MEAAEDPKDISRVQSREKDGETAIVSEKYADVTLRLVEQYGDQFGPLTPEKEKKLRRKLYWHVMGLLSAINLLLFVRHLTRRCYLYTKLSQIDKSTLGYAAILGLFEETGINKAQYNNLGTFFYVGTYTTLVNAKSRKLTYGRISCRTMAWTLSHAETPLWQICRRLGLHVGNHYPPTLCSDKVRRFGCPSDSPWSL
jgi:hypothetical protein